MRCFCDGCNRARSTGKMIMVAQGPNLFKMDFLWFIPGVSIPLRVRVL